MTSGPARRPRVLHHEAGARPATRPVCNELGGVPERLRTFQKICEAVSFAHAHHVLHRDLKPQNIMVGRFGEVLVMDWGLAKLLNAEISAEADSSPKMSLQQPRAPTQIRPRRTRRTAWFSGLPVTWRRSRHAAMSSCGSAFGRLLPGRSAQFFAGTLRRGAQSIGRDWQQSTAEDPEQRYGSVEELANDIAHYLDGMPVSAYPEGPLARLWRWVVEEQRLDSADRSLSGNAGFVYFVAGTVKWGLGKLGMSSV